MRMLDRKSDTRGLSTLVFIVALKELGLMKCVLKYGGGGMGGGAWAGMVLADVDGRGISLEGLTGVSLCVTLPIVD